MDGVFAAASKNRPCIAQVGEGFCIPRRVLVLVLLPRYPGILLILPFVFALALVLRLTHVSHLAWIVLVLVSHLFSPRRQPACRSSALLHWSGIIAATNLLRLPPPAVRISAASDPHSIVVPFPSFLLTRFSSMPLRHLCTTHICTYSLPLFCLLSALASFFSSHVFLPLFVVG